MQAELMAEKIALICDRQLTQFVTAAGYDRPGCIPAAMTFRQWCDDLASRGLKVDEKPFTLDDRPAMHRIYDLIPTTIEEARGRTLVLMKSAQVGFTVLEMLATLYMALKFEPVKIGMFLPDMKLAGLKSTVRYMPILRLVPDAYARLTEEDPATGRKRIGEGNVLTRQLGSSTILFLWTSGKAMTESMPMDILSFDEVQEMQIADMEKTKERMSASRIKFTLMGSTANWPDSDIHYWYKRGTRERFNTRCPSCGGRQVMDDHFPPREGHPCCIGYDEGLQEWRYVCVACGGWIDDVQQGDWVAEQPSAYDPVLQRGIESLHFPQFLSPTISPREMMEGYHNATDLKNYFNRKLGKPFSDPSQVPVTLEHLRACAAAGAAAGLTWRKTGRQTFMGVDNMGGFSCAVVLERMATGRMALVHVEQVHGLDPWARLSQMMREYDVAVAVCEQLPNYDSAKQFAGRHVGRVFLVSSYKDIPDDMLQWGDATQSRADRKTASEHRDRYTVNLDQYKMMSWALARITTGFLMTPDPKGLVQDILVKKVPRTVALLSEVVWDHLTRTALVTEQSEEEHKITRKVKKIGLDPHFSFALMMACAAWCRSHGTGSFIMPDLPDPSPAGSMAAHIEATMPGISATVTRLIEDAPAGTCGRCTSYQDGRCVERNFNVAAREPSCFLYAERPSE